MDARTAAEGGSTPQAPTALYAQAGTRETKFTHFSASRNDTRAQFRRWISGEPGSFRLAERRSEQSSGLPPVALPRQPRGGPLPNAQWAAPSSPEPGHLHQQAEDDAGILPQWLRAAEHVEAGRDEADGTLSDAAARLSSRWLLLEEIFPSPRTASSLENTSGGVNVAPAVLAFSIAGGTGKTTLLATLGRALAARGERVLLADTALFSLAASYFGAHPGGSSAVSTGSQAAGSEPANEIKEEPGSELGRQAGGTRGSIRTFSPPEGGGDVPLDILLLPASGRRAGDAGTRDAMREALLRHGGKADRILVDLPSAAESVARQLLWLEPWVLVPLLPDLNSVATVAVVEKVFAGRLHAGSGAAKLVYVLNQYDSSLPLHLDVREVLQRRLGGRLLPFVLRRSQQVSEALAEGMTVIDYAPDSPAAEDYARLADWLRGVAPPASRGLERFRWSER